jgi:hypothetical protein
MPTPTAEGNGLDADSDFGPDCQRPSSGMRSKNIHCHSGSICCSSVGSLCASMNARVPAVSPCSSRRATSCTLAAMIRHIPHPTFFNIQRQNSNGSIVLPP